MQESSSLQSTPQLHHVWRLLEQRNQHAEHASPRSLSSHRLTGAVVTITRITFKGKTVGCSTSKGRYGQTVSA